MHRPTMRHVVASVGLGLVAASSNVCAQDFVTIGTDPFAEILNGNAEALTWEWRQTFIAEGPLLESLTVWWEGGSLASASEPLDDQTTVFFLGTVPGGDPHTEVSLQAPLDQSHAGRFVYRFGGSPFGYMVPGREYYFGFRTTSCGPVVDGGCSFRGKPITGENSFFTVDLTGDTYDGGMFWDYSGGEFLPDRDIRFEARFYAVPEPGTPLLLLTGLLGIATAARRRHSILMG